MNQKHVKSDFGVIFDVDGTMVDNIEYHKNAWIELGRQKGFPIDEQFYHNKIHARCNERIVKTLIGQDATHEQIEVISELKENIYRSSFAPVMKEIPGLTNLLMQFNSVGIPCGAASNSPKGNVDFVLDGLNIRQYFKSVIDRDQVTTGKPDPELFLTSAGNLGLTPGRCLIVEDSSSGFKAAQNAQMRCVAITYGHHEDNTENLTIPIARFNDYTLITLRTIRDIMKLSQNN